MHLSAPVRNWLESLLGFIGLEAQTLTLPTDHNPIIDIGGDKNKMNKMTHKGHQIRVDEQVPGFVHLVNRSIPREGKRRPQKGMPVMT